MKVDYRTTLNLPQTDFPMRARLPEREPEFLKFWDEIALYHKLLEKYKSCPSFILHDGPPYANGDIHLGHALNKTLKDIIVRFKFMTANFAPFIPGWDCHGLPVEHQLFKELGLKKQDIAITDFRKKAKDYALRYVNVQRQQFKRLGIIGDWEHPYLTLDPHYESAILFALAELVAKGYVYRGVKPVNWCINCETALAEAEVEYQDHVSDSIYVKFPAIDLEELDNAFFLIWTTTPWTLISNVAIALNPEADYIACESDQGVLIFASTLKEQLLKTLPIRINKEISSFKGHQLERKLVQHPFLDRKSQVVTAGFVSLEEGTGCVHIAPGHGEEDWLLAQEKNLEVIMPLDERGYFTEEIPLFKGEQVWSASKKVIAILKEKGLLLAQGEITHSYPHCWRCKSPIVFRATAQWFLAIDRQDLRGKILDQINKVRWIPRFGQVRIKAMIEQRPDWCLSRQRYWGVPIPSVRCCNCGNSILSKDLILKLAEKVKESGSDIWFQESLENFLPSEFKCPQCGSDSFEKELDIIDVWFESGVSYHAVLKQNPELKFPADLYLEGSDQHRGWFQTSIIPAVAIDGKAPYHIVLTHGFVVDGEGRKMSKSLGNVISPQDVINRYGSDVLRLWVVTRDYSEDLRISDEILEQVANDYRKIRNTAKFLLSNLYDFDPENAIPEEELDELDRWALHETRKSLLDAITSYKEYKFHRVYRLIYQLCSETLSAIYLDILKDRLYTFHPNSPLRRSSQSVLYEIVKCLALMIAPILPFTAEDIWRHLKKRKADNVESVHLYNLNDLKLNIDEQLLSKWSKLLEIRSFVCKALEEKRSEGLIHSSLEAKVCLKFELDSIFKFVDNNKSMLETFFIVSQVALELVDKIEGNFFETREGEKVKIDVTKAEGKKCARCWIYSPSVGSDPAFEDICAKCVSVLEELKL